MWPNKKINKYINNNYSFGGGSKKRGMPSVIFAFYPAMLIYADDSTLFCALQTLVEMSYIPSLGENEQIITEHCQN